MIEVDYELSAEITNALRARRRRRMGGFSPLGLFRSSEPGVWLDPSDLSTLFQDAAGTTPVTAAGQSVALVLDKSGRGNHATQPASSARPTLARVPIGGARNIARFSAADTFWKAEGTHPPTVLLQQSHLGHSCAAISFAAGTPAGFSVSRADRHFPGTTTHPITPGVTYAMSSMISLSRQLTGTEQVTVYQTGSAAASNLVLTATNTASLVNLWQRVTHPVTATSGNSGSAYPVVFVSQSLSAQPLTVYIRDIQIEVGSASTEYQRTTTIHDVTQEGLRDCWYLSFDGVDDFLVTPTITPETDKVQVFAGIRKLSDAARTTLVELGDGATIAGSFNIEAPGVATTPTYRFKSEGSTASFAGSPSSFAAPITNVLTGIGDISGDLATLRVNGSQAAQSTADQGAGNFLAYPLYIGRRGGTTLPFNGHLYGLITRFGPNLTADQIAQAERWMAQRTGVTL